jgi:heme-degrading monooxygenase HmoA
MDETYTCSIWTVNQGEEDSFLTAFGRFADEATKNFGAREGVILRDTDDPPTFIVIRRWESAQSLQNWADSAEMPALLAPIRATIAGESDAYITTKVADLG